MDNVVVTVVNGVLYDVDRFETFSEALFERDRLRCEMMEVGFVGNTTERIQDLWAEFLEQNPNTLVEVWTW